MPEIIAWIVIVLFLTIIALIMLLIFMEHRLSSLRRELRQQQARHTFGILQEVVAQSTMAVDRRLKERGLDIDINDDDNPLERDRDPNEDDDEPFEERPCW